MSSQFRCASTIGVCLFFLWMVAGPSYSMDLSSQDVNWDPSAVEQGVSVQVLDNPASITAGYGTTPHPDISWMVHGAISDGLGHTGYGLNKVGSVKTGIHSKVSKFRSKADGINGDHLGESFRGSLGVPFKRVPFKY